LANRHGTREGNIIKIRIALNYDELAQMSNVQKPILMQVLRDLQEKQILVPTQTDLQLNLAKLRY
jgi:CRP/FNR family transcriptional regulator, cyclic AMP receptor protein